jgi:KDO2-lipid IV(A) lauroyltransferase
MAKKQNLVVDYLVYLAVRTVVCVLQALSMEYGYKFANALALLAHSVDKRHRRVAEENLRIAFGDRLSPKQRKRMVFEVYRHFARMIVEIAHIPRRMHVTNWKKYAQIHNCSDALGLILSDRPKILVTAHFGNWEMAGYLLAAIGMKSYAIARDLDNRFLHRFLLRFRQWSGQTILSKTGDFDRIQNVLATNQLLISVGDQSAGPRGYFVNFFGRPASTHKAIALLALQFNAPIIIGYAFRTGDRFHYEVGSAGIIDPQDYTGSSRDVATAITEDFTGRLEAVIRRAPEQYLWLHNRWKHKPPEKKAKPIAA